MAKQKLTIEVDVRDGYELKYNPETRTIEEVKTEPIRSKSWEDFCKNHKYVDKEWYIDNCGNIASVNGSRKCLNNLSTREDAEGILALIQLTRLHDEWVDGWVPNWETSPNYSNRYVITHIYKTFAIDEDCHDYRLLAFPTTEMAEEFLTCFEDLIEKAKKFI